MAQVTVSDLTSGTLEGSGAFDVLMQTTKAHVHEEYTRGRIKGSEYAQVYLGSIQAVMQNALQLLLESQRTNLEAQLLEEQILTEQKKRLQIEGEIALLTAQTAKTTAETLNIPKQGTLIDNQAAQVLKQTSLLDKQILQADEELALKQAQVDVALAEVGIAQAKLVNIPKEGVLLDAQASHTAAQTALVTAQELKVDQETANGVTQGLILTQQITTETNKHDQQVAETELTTNRAALTLSEKAVTDQNALNAVTQGLVLTAQKCKLEADFDLTVEQRNRTVTEITKLGSEINLLNQKELTEKAQVTALGVDADSVIGRQKDIYAKQAWGYERDAEQKAAKMMIDAMMTIFTTDQTSPSEGGITGSTIAAVVNKLKTGIGA